MPAIEQLDKMAIDDESIDNVGLGCALDSFAEVNEVLEMISNLKTVYNAQLSIVERAYERYVCILDQYHEQPHLLDAHIDKVLGSLIDIVRNDNPMELKHTAYKYMYNVVKVRGYKVIVRHLPHEVADFEPVLKCLEQQDSTDTETWTTRYVLLLWLSIIVKIPFHMSRLDDTESSAMTVMSRMFNVCKLYAVVGDKCRDAAAYLASQFLTRVDIKEIYLPLFFDWACEVTTDKTCNTFAKRGALATIANILKHGKREDLLPYAGRLLQWIINTEYKDTSGTHVPKLGFKIVQRIGLTFLPPRVALWRYKRGNRSLTTNLSSGDASKDSAPKANELPEEEDFEVPEEIEEIIDQLLQGLRSSDGVVRWSAAKGIGRVTGRLPRELADEVLGSILELFTPREGDGAWHGGCLTLAELGRRGLLLPQRLDEVVPVVVKALMYDELRGYVSVGAHIRDSACYVCWAFARAYDVDVLKPYVEEIARTLLIVAVFDREINCRRAASAAFQENVGRQGTFPYGIDILTVADFFAVGLRHNSYLNISVYIAQYSEYTTALIDHLVDRKVDHWDSAIRELTAKALHNLTAKAPEYMANVVLDKLFEKTALIDLNARHGSVLALGEIIHALSLIADEQGYELSVLLKEPIVGHVRSLIPGFRERLLFRGLGGELMKQACSKFIKKCSLAHVPLQNADITDDWLNLLNECLSYDVPTVRTAAIDALPAFLTEYYQNNTKQVEKQQLIIQTYIEKLKEHNKVARMGYVLALGSLPDFMLKRRLEDIISAISKITEITETTLKWSESRRDAIKALTQITESVCATDIGLTDDQINRIYGCYLTGLKEYTQDNRGDIGAWVREASMSGIQMLTHLLTVIKPSILNEDLVRNIMASICQQAVEKIDRTRALAGKIFSYLIHHVPTIPNIPNHERLQEIFHVDECELLNWNSEIVTFPRFVRILPLKEYTYNLLLGLIVSIGGLTETLVKSSSASFFAYMQSLHEEKNSEEINRICDTILDIFVKHQRVDRITVPTFRFLEKLMSLGCLESTVMNESSAFPSQLLRLIKHEINGCRDIYKLIDGIGVLCQFVQVNTDVGRSAIVELTILLCHRHTYVRKSTSTRLYEALLVYDDCVCIPLENVDTVMSILSDTNWEQPVDVLRPIRNNLCELMQVRVPVLKSRK